MATKGEREAIRDAVRGLLRADRTRGELRGRDHYKNLFPGFWDLVDEEHSRLLEEAGEATRRAGEASAPASASPPPPVPGPGEPRAQEGGGSAAERIGPYRVIRELGRGGMGVVHLAEDLRIHRRVALKVLSPQFASSEALLRRFRREAEAASRLDHPGLCPVYEAELEGAVPYIAMRYVEGRTLQQWIAASRSPTEGAAGGDGAERVTLLPGSEAPPPPPSPGPPLTTSALRKREAILRVIHLVEKAARALHVAHEAGLVHRDIKPGNIMVAEDGEPVVLDFGLARADDEGATHLTQTGAAMGTPAYMAPEQVTGDRAHIDRRTDVYALGATLYECLTLRLPFEAATLDALYRKILSTDADDPRRANPVIPEDLAVVLATTLEKDPGRRYRTALEFAEDLRRVREWEPIRARPPGLWYRASRFVRRHQVPVAAVGVTTLCVGALAWSLLSARIGETPETLLETAEQLRDAKQAEAARILFEKAVERGGWMQDVAGGVAPEKYPPTAQRILRGLTPYLGTEGRRARDRGDLKEALAILRRAATTAYAAGTRDSQGYRQDAEVCRILLGAERGDVTEVRNLLELSITVQTALESTLDGILPFLGNPSSPWRDEAARVVAVALAYPRTEASVPWLAARSELPGDAIVALLAAAAPLNDAVFPRFRGNLENATPIFALWDAAAKAQAVADAIGKEAFPPRERAAALRLLEDFADIPPGPREGEERERWDLATWQAVRTLDAREGWRVRVERAVVEASSGNGDAETWLLLRTGLANPPDDGWEAWWRRNLGRDPRAVVAGNLGIAEEPASLPLDAIYGKFLSAPDSRKASFHTLLALWAPPEVTAPVWPALTGEGKPRPLPPAIWEAWPAALGDRLPGLRRRFQIAHYALGDWAPRPEVAWKENREVQAGLPVDVRWTTPVVVPTLSPFSLIVALEGPDSLVDRRYASLVTPPSVTYQFQAGLRMEFRPEGPALAWRGIQLPGDYLHSGNLWAPEDELLVRTTAGTAGAGSEGHYIHEVVLGAMLPEPGAAADSADPVWEARIAASLAGLLRTLPPAPPEPGPGIDDLRRALRRIGDQLLPAFFFPLAGREKVLRELEDALRPLQPARPAEVLLLRHQVALARLLGGDAGAIPDFPDLDLKPWAGRRLPGPNLYDGWRGQSLLVRIAATSEIPEIREFAARRLATTLDSIPFGDHRRLAEALDDGRIPENAVLRRKISQLERPGASPPVAWALLAGLVALIGGALAFALRPGATVEGRLRAAVLLVAVAPALVHTRIEMPGFLPPTAAIGALLGTLGAWILAVAGAGWSRLVPPVLISVTATAFVSLLFRSNREFVELGTLGLFFHVWMVPTLSEGLDRRREPRPKRAPAEDAGLPFYRRYFRGSAARTILAAFPCSMTAGFLAKWRDVNPGTPSLALLLVMLPLVGWLIWVYVQLWRAAGKRAGAPSLAARAWARVRRRPRPA